ncbi:hypothetical protein B0H13DRAFT_1888828 [Mycena leptocephala]|nr:hypothetical protein B0H13DRAFT_1888828 [Mycena leptocephala]
MGRNKPKGRRSLLSSPTLLEHHPQSAGPGTQSTAAHFLCVLSSKLGRCPMPKMFAFAPNEQYIAAPPVKSTKRFFLILYDLQEPYCSQQCQRGDWKSHKNHCKASTMPDAPPTVEGYAGQMMKLMARRTGKKDGVYDAAGEAGLDVDLLCGASGMDVYESNGGDYFFWLLDEAEREDWEAKAQVHNRKTRRFWIGFAEPMSVDHNWTDIVLKSILQRRMPITKESTWQDQMLTGLFPHLSKFTATQNSALLDVFDLCGDDTFRIAAGASVLFSFGEPSADLIDQLVQRCLSPTRSSIVLKNLFEYVAFPIQKHWAHLAGTRILDLALAVLCPKRQGGSVPGHEICQISPTACAHLLPAVLAMCIGGTGGLSKPAFTFLDLLLGFRAAMDTEVYMWLLGAFSGDEESKWLLEDLARATRANTRFGIEAKSYSVAELTQLYCSAMERLGDPQKAAGAVSHTAVFAALSRDVDVESSGSLSVQNECWSPQRYEVHEAFPHGCSPEVNEPHQLNGLVPKSDAELVRAHQAKVDARVRELNDSLENIERGKSLAAQNSAELRQRLAVVGEERVALRANGTLVDKPSPQQRGTRPFQRIWKVAFSSAPVRRVPADVLVDIFMAVQSMAEIAALSKSADARLMGRERPELLAVGHGPAAVISQVSSGWRATACGHPALWSSFSFSPYGSQKTDLAAIYLERARSAPLTVEMVLKPSSKDQTNADRAIAVLAASTLTLFELRLVADTERPAPIHSMGRTTEAFPSFQPLRGRLPRLEILQVPESLAVADAFEFVPSLHTLNICAWGHISSSGPEPHPGPKFAQGARFSLTTLVLRKCQMRVSELINLLEITPHLEVLAIVDGLSTIVTDRLLRYLTVRSELPDDHNLPKLSSLTLSGSFAFGNVALVEMLESRTANGDCVCLHDVFLSLPQRVVQGEVLDRLRRLAMDGVKLFLECFDHSNVMYRPV